MVNPSNKVWRDSTKNNTLNPTFRIGNSLGYTNEKNNEMAELVDINNNDHESTKCIINFLQVKTKVFTKELLKSRNVRDIASLPIYSHDYINESKNIIQEKLIMISQD